MAGKIRALRLDTSGGISGQHYLGLACSLTMLPYLLSIEPTVWLCEKRKKIACAGLRCMIVQKRCGTRTSCFRVVFRGKGNLVPVPEDDGSKAQKHCDDSCVCLQRDMDHARGLERDDLIAPGITSINAGDINAGDIDD